MCRDRPFNVIGEYASDVLGMTISLLTMLARLALPISQIAKLKTFNGYIAIANISDSFYHLP